MNRHSKILLGPAKSTCPQTLDRLATADILPGTLVNIASDKFAAIAAANSKAGVQLYVASENWCNGSQVSDTNKANETMFAYRPMSGVIYAGLLKTGENVADLDTPLAISDTAGVFKVGTVGTDHIVAYAREIFNNTTGESQLISFSWAQE